MVGIIYTEPVVYEAYPSKFLDDEIFSILAEFYRKFWLSKSRRKEVIKLLDAFWSGETTKQSLKGKLKNLLRGEESDVDFPDNGENLSTSKTFTLFSHSETNGIGFKRTLEIEVEGSDYIFSEGIRYKALKRAVNLLSEEFEYMEQFGETLEYLAPVFEGKLLNTLTDIGAKTLVVAPQFLEVEGDKAIYSLKLVNLYPQLKAQKIVEKYPLVLENLKKISAENERGLKVLETFEKNYPLLVSLYKRGEYLKLLKLYLVLKAYRELMLAGLMEKNLVKELKEKIGLLVSLYKKQFADLPKIKRYLKKGSRTVGKGTQLGRYTFHLREKIGKVLVLEKLSAYKLKSLFEFKAFPFDELFFHPLETIGQLLDAVFLAYTLTRKVDSVILSVSSSDTGLEYRRLKAVLNLFVNNQTITERGYSALKFGKDNLLRSLQKVERAGEIEGNFRLQKPVSVIVETHPSNRIAEVSREDYERLNEITAHRLFRVFNLYPENGKILVENAGWFGILAGDFASAELVSSVQNLTEPVIFITTTLLSPASVEKLLKRLTGTSLRYTLLNLEEVNFLLDRPLSPSEGIVYSENGIVEFVRPLPPAIAKRAVNERGFRYRILHSSIETDTLIEVLSALHLYASDSKNFPFAELKLSKQRLGKIRLKEEEVYFSVLLLEAFFRLKKIENSA